LQKGCRCAPKGLLSAAESSPFTLQKDSFYTLKGLLLQHEGTALGKQPRPGLTTTKKHCEAEEASSNLNYQPTNL